MPDYVKIWILIYEVRMGLILCNFWQSPRLCCCWLADHIFQHQVCRLGAQPPAGCMSAVLLILILYWPPHPHTHPCVLCQYSYLLSISWWEEVWKCLVEFRYTEYLKLVREQHSFTQSYFILTLLRKEKKLMLAGATVYEEFENSPMSLGFLWGLWFYLTSQRCSR